MAVSARTHQAADAPTRAGGCLRDPWARSAGCPLDLSLPPYDVVWLAPPPWPPDER